MLGFVGSPWTLATYLIEGGSTSLYKTIKTMCFSAPEVGKVAACTHRQTWLLIHLRK